MTEQEAPIRKLHFMFLQKGFLTFLQKHEMYFIRSKEDMKYTLLDLKRRATERQKSYSSFLLRSFCCCCSAARSEAPPLGPLKNKVPSLATLK